MRHGKLLGLNKPFLYRLTGNVVDMMGGVYPELKDSREYIARLVLVEEERFIGTLEYGTKMLNDIIKNAAARRVRIPCRAMSCLSSTIRMGSRWTW